MIFYWSISKYQVAIRFVEIEGVCKELLVEIKQESCEFNWALIFWSCTNQLWGIIYLFSIIIYYVTLIRR